MQAYNASGQSAKVKDNETFAQDKLTMVKAHMEYILFHVARTKIESTEFQDPKVKEHLILLTKISALDLLINQGAVVFDSGFFAPGSYSNLQKAQKICIENLRPQMIPIVETMDAPDEFWPSVIGNSYGDIYEW